MIRQRPLSILTACTYLVSSVLIIAAARGDLWLDEIWSINIARSAETAADIFSRFHFDNNHPLNTLFLYYVQAQHAPSFYRLFAVLSGIGSVFLVGLIARHEWGEPEAFCSIALAGTSYPLLLYFSEARGYGPAMFFALLSYAVLRRNTTTLKSHRLMMYWAACVLGVLSHLTFVIVFLSNCIMHLSEAIRSGGLLRTRFGAFLLHQVPPSIILAAWSVFFAQDMGIGGGPVYGKFDVVAEASALLLGLPETAPFQGPAVILVLAIVAAGSLSLFRAKDTAWLFFSSALFLSPILLFVLAKPKFFYFRYFIVCFPFFYLILSYLLCRTWRLCSRYWRWLIVTMALLLIGAQSLRVYPLLEFGRGNYLAALTHILEKSPRPIVRVGSDHDFRNYMLIDFYARLIPGGRRLRYIEQSRWREEPPDWMLMHSQEVSHRPPDEFTLGPALVYQYVDQYRFSGISGWNWYLFRRQTPAAESK